MKVAILSSREFSDPNLIEDTLDEIHSKNPIEFLLLPKELRSGLHAGDWAFMNKIETEERMINWKSSLGIKAGSVRNDQMIEDSDYCILFFTDSNSPEINWIMQSIEKHNKPFFVCKKNLESQ